jgi:hypothetical protein
MSFKQAIRLKSSIKWLDNNPVLGTKPWKGLRYLKTIFNLYWVKMNCQIESNKISFGRGDSS